MLWVKNQKRMHAPTLLYDMPLMVQLFFFQVKVVVSPLERCGGALFPREDKIIQDINQG